MTDQSGAVTGPTESVTDRGPRLVVTVFDSVTLATADQAKGLTPDEATDFIRKAYLAHRDRYFALSARLELPLNDTCLEW